MKIELTVCLITYNQEKYVREALDSILSQKTSFSWDVVIYDDHSTDGTADILKSYAQEHSEKIKLVIQNSNVGALENWKQLLEAASSKYIAYIEGDDYWIDDRKLQKQYAALEGNPSLGLVYAQGIQCIPDQSDGQVVGKSVDRLTFYLSNPVPSSTVVFRRQCLEGFFEELGNKLRSWKMSDYPLWLWISSKWEVAFLGEPMSVYRVLPNSATRSSSKEPWIRSKIDIIDYFYRKDHAGTTLYYLLGKVTLLAEVVFHRTMSVLRKAI